jgi:hypothetical protein
MKSSRSGSAGAVLISDNQAGREKTVVNIGLSSKASVIDAMEESINYYAETWEPSLSAILLIFKGSSVILLL